jgi:peptide/nickel transport system substrate-binding protein
VRFTQPSGDGACAVSLHNRSCIWTNLDLMSPVINLNLDGRGRRGYVGWTDGAEMEHLREAFAFGTDPAKQQPIATELQRL